MSDPIAAALAEAMRPIVADAVADALAELLDGETRTPPALLTKTQLAQALQCSIPKIDLMRREGMPWVGIGDAVRFELSAVLDWLRTRGRGRDAA